MILKRFLQRSSPRLFFVSYMLQYPIEPHFTYLNEVLEMDAPVSKADIVNIETTLRLKLIEKMRNDDKTVRVTLLNWKELR